MIITISGLPGSGKTSVARELAGRLGYRFYSIGDLRGKMAMDRGLTIDQLNMLGEREDWTDRDADRYQEKLGREEDNFVIDSWIGFHFIPRSAKVFLEVREDEAAERIFRDQRPDEERKKSPEAVKGMLRERLRQTCGRYRKYYNLDFLDRGHYDLVIDTTRLTVKQVAEKILGFLKEHPASQGNGA